MISACGALLLHIINMSTHCLISWLGSMKSRNIFHIFMSVTWLSGLIYYMLGQLLETRRSSHVRHHINSDVLAFSDSHAETRQLLLNLGFTAKPKLYPADYEKEDNLPVFILTLEKHQIDSFYGFLVNFKFHFPDKRLIIYNVDLSEDDVDMVRNKCQCQVREIDWQKYPSHVHSKRHFHAYRPILIQETLVEFGIVFWCDVMIRFISSDLSPYLAQAESSGVITWWCQQYPTSALTHYNMFRYFNTNNTNFYFQRAAQPDMALLVNTDRVHKQLMLPWIRCCLDKECIAPRGSQPGGCNFMHKPKYIYAGCHHYDVSAYNIILGQMFNMETPYLGSDKLFVSLH